LNPPKPPLGIGHYIRFGWSESIKAVAIIPRFELSTAKAREVLPTQYSRKDLVRVSALCLTDCFLNCPAGIQLATIGRLDHGTWANATGSRSNLRSNEGPSAPALSQAAGKPTFSFQDH
jgi:hypothetical protein